MHHTITTYQDATLALEANTLEQALPVAANLSDDGALPLTHCPKRHLTRTWTPRGRWVEGQCFRGSFDPVSTQVGGTGDATKHLLRFDSSF